MRRALHLGMQPQTVDRRAPMLPSGPTSLAMAAWLLVLVACGSSKAPEATPERKASSGLPAGKWTGMSIAAKAQHMNDVVMPRMTAVFQAENAEKYALVECGLCHRAGVVSGDFTMPDSGLPQFESYAAIERDAPDVIVFMERVEKEMASALGVPVYDPATHKGLKCTTCHVVGKKSPAPPAAKESPTE